MLCLWIGTKIREISLSDCNLDFSMVCAKDTYITHLPDFQYGNDIINNAVLDPKGFKMSSDGCVIKSVQICKDCLSGLKQSSIPRLSLANFLYRGKLPDEFQDLTWVEEMVCAKYRNTAHVTRIYGCSDPSQPKVFHGNTCAHEMNVLSTASVLP